MQDAFYIAAIGLQAQQQRLTAAANNFANIDTPAYKRQSVDFSTILGRSSVPAGAGAVTAADASAASVLRFDLSQGAVHGTARPLDLAISGPGFIEVALPADKTGYVRGGSLQINPEGGLSLPGGQPLKADVRIPGGAVNVQILPDGSVTGALSGETNARVLGQIELVTFANPEGLQYRGDGIFIAPEGGPEPVRVRPGEEGTQPLSPQSLEGSNVDMTSEMVSMSLIQRAYELNSHVAQIADELMGMANNMRRD
jgi:flagellar basal-body rod protein FlgG